MKILIGFEFSGKVRDAFKAKGHDAWSCDLLPSVSNNDKHLKCDIFEALTAFKWDFIGLHPVCTAMSLCGNRHYGKGMSKHIERVNALQFTKRVWETAKALSPKAYLEQPKTILGNVIGKKSQTIHPWQYGHKEQKETWLWLHGLSPLVETNNVYDEMMLLPQAQREREYSL